MNDLSRILVKLREFLGTRKNLADNIFNKCFSTIMNAKKLHSFYVCRATQCLLYNLVSILRIFIEYAEDQLSLQSQTRLYYGHISYR